jgi:hypothetical protein
MTGIRGKHLRPLRDDENTFVGRAVEKRLIILKHELYLVNFNKFLKKQEPATPNG